MCDIDVQVQASSLLSRPVVRWALMAARGWARPILDRGRDLINDLSNRATAEEAPLGVAQESCHFDNPTTHTRGAYHQGEAA